MKANSDGKAKSRVSYTPSAYTRILETYPSKDAAYVALGVNSRVRGHAAKVLKGRNEYSIFCCKLFRQDPPCKWTAALFQNRRGFELRGLDNPSSNIHNSAAPPVESKRGIETLDLKRELEKSLSSTISMQPRSVYRAHLLQDSEKEATDARGIDAKELPAPTHDFNLKQVQWLKIKKS